MADIVPVNFRIWRVSDKGENELLYPETSVNQVVGLKEALASTVVSVNGILPDKTNNVTTEVILDYGAPKVTLQQVLDLIMANVKIRVRLIINNTLFLADLSCFAPDGVLFTCLVGTTILNIRLDNTNTWSISESKPKVDSVVEQNLYFNKSAATQLINIVQAYNFYTITLQELGDYKFSLVVSDSAPQQFYLNLVLDPLVKETVRVIFDTCTYKNKSVNFLLPQAYLSVSLDRGTFVQCVCLESGIYPLLNLYAKPTYNDAEGKEPLSQDDGSTTSK